MANINLRFTTERSKGTKKKLSLKAIVKGKTNGHYKDVQGLINPDFNYWDSKSQCFNQASTDAIHNNNVLRMMLNHYQRILDVADIKDGKELFAHNEAATVQAAKQLTLGIYLERLIDRMKHETIKNPSANYQNYITLLHKLQDEGKIINTPLNQVTNTHFKAFRDYIFYSLNGVNYEHLMRMFQATINKAFQDELTTNVLTYKYKQDKPNNVEKDMEKAKTGVGALSEREYKAFLDLDLSTLPAGNNSQRQYYELYRDFCVFMYETKIRPEDVAKLHSRDINTDNGTIFYWIGKGKNWNTCKSFVTTTITPKAQQIINKYAGQSSKGYVFPFAMNEYDWDFKDYASFHKWKNKWNSQLESINKFLKKAAAALNLKNMTTYYFRRSTFTHKIKQGVNLMQLAKEGGTSLEMFNNHYYDSIIGGQTL